MVRTIPTDLLQQLNSGRVTSKQIWLIQISHADLETPIRICGNDEDVSHDGNTYIAFDLAIAIPDEKDRELPQRELILSNIDNATVLAPLRSLEHQTTDRPVVVGAWIREDDLEEVVVGPLEYELLRFRATTKQVQLTLGFQQIANDNFPSYYVYPSKFRSAF